MRLGQARRHDVACRRLRRASPIGGREVVTAWSRLKEKESRRRRKSYGRKHFGQRKSRREEDQKKGLSFYTTDKILAESFSQFGQVVEAKVVMDRVSDRSKGFGFVTFASEDEAYRAVTEMNGKTLNGRIVFVDYAKPRLGEKLGMPIARGPPEPKVDDN